MIETKFIDIKTKNQDIDFIDKFEIYDSLFVNRDSSNCISYIIGFVENNCHIYEPEDDFKKIADFNINRSVLGIIDVDLDYNNLLITYIDGTIEIYRYQFYRYQKNDYQILEPGKNLIEINGQPKFHFLNKLAKKQVYTFLMCIKTLPSLCKPILMSIVQQSLL